MKANTRCKNCHQWVTEEWQKYVEIKREIEKSQNISKALKRAKASGVRIGRPPLKIDIDEIQEMREKGMSLRKIASKLNISTFAVIARLEK